MSGAVFRGVEQQTLHGRRQARTPDLSFIQEDFSRRPAQLVERAIDESSNSGDHVGKRRRRIARCALLARGGALRVGQRLSARIGEQAVECPAGMPYVKPDRRRASRTLPDVPGWHGQGQTLEILADLNQRVNNRHQQRIKTRDRSSLPRFSLRN